MGILNAVEGIRVIKNENNRGPAYSRNKAIGESTGEIFLLIDSDCIVDDEALISKHVLAHRDPSVHIVGGGVQGVGKGCVAKADRYSHWFLNIPYSANQLGTHLVSNNMSVKREVFERIGGFKEELRTGEDTDFCERALKAGCVMKLRTDAVVKHRDRERLRDFLKCFYLVGLDRIPVRRANRHRFWFLFPFGPISSLIYCLPLALLLSLQVILAWFPYDKKVILYSPLVFAGRLAMTLGIVSYCFRRSFFRRSSVTQKR
jgi:GT2 family glycosyltransferase